MAVDQVPSPAEAFVRELARSPQRAHILARLKDGHHRDPHGYCRHPSHDHRWERHPCPTLRLAEWVEAVEPVARAADTRTWPLDHQVG